MLVLKFGGTSVGTSQAVSQLISVIKEPSHAGKVGVIVVSALSGITDALINAAKNAVVERGSSGAVAEALAGMKRRHLELAAAFLSGREQKAAGEEIENTFAELSRLLDGIALLGELSSRSMDSIVSYGERLSAPLIARFLCASGVSAEYLDSRQLIVTDNSYGAARVNTGKTYKKIKKNVNAGILYVASGFVARAEDGSVTTLGRGGSDLTAALYGAALDAETVEIWTDVDGILTADPKLVKNAFRIDSLSYEEAMELSHFGAKVLHPPTVRPALEKGIPIVVKNTFNPSCPGTRISKDAERGEYPIRGISSLSRVTLVCLQGSGMVGVAGFSSRLFGALARRKISVILISQASSEYSICVAVDPKSGDDAAAALKEEFSREIAEGAVDAPTVEKDFAVIAVVGGQMKHVSGISGKVFHALGRNGINVAAIAQGSSELNISLVINRSNEAKALNSIHEAFFHATVRSVNLFLMGAGLIGGTLLEQIANHRKTLADKDKININLIGVANDKWMLFDREGLDPLKARALVNEEGGAPKTGKAGKNKKAAKSEITLESKNNEQNNLEPVNLKTFFKTMVSYNLPNACFCDCTANLEISALYAKILSASIPVVTPNKRANSGKLEYYQQLTGFSRGRGIPYLYETTV
ncbi:MAG: aspartate kinase, partial [Spirochaetaceae bacterium]|nr:aspartate kinase [Spirochaetaceae bacterium]